MSYMMYFGTKGLRSRTLGLLSRVLYSVRDGISDVGMSETGGRRAGTPRA